MLKFMERAVFQYFLIISVFLVITVCLYYSLYLRPYLGFEFDTITGQILSVDPPVAEIIQPIQVGDYLTQIGTLDWVNFQKKGSSLFEGVQHGDRVVLVMRRGDYFYTISVIARGPTGQDLFKRLQLVWLCLPFWISGTATLLLLRPRDIRWRLLVVFNYLLALWIAIGEVGASGQWYSYDIYIFLSWMCLPVFLHLHWFFPKTLGRLPAILVWVGYIGSLCAALAEIRGLIPLTGHFISLLLALAGSLSLLILHAVRSSEIRRDLTILLVTIVAIVAPAVLYLVLGLFSKSNWGIPVIMILFPSLPAAYFFIGYRRQLGGLELRVNHTLVILVFAISLTIIFIGGATVVSLLLPQYAIDFTINLAIALFIGFIGALLFTPYRRWAERNLLGMPLPPVHLLETYSARILTSLEKPQLISLVRDEVMPTLLIRQAVLLRLRGEKADHLPSRQETLLSFGVQEPQLPGLNESAALLRQAGSYRPQEGSMGPADPCPWVRLVLALKVGDKLVGLCLFGRRDPDDYYAPTEIPTLQALMDQTALALLNIEQAEHLLVLYQRDVESRETELRRLARDLHDVVLAQVSRMVQMADDVQENTALQEAYQKTVDQIRSIISGLRPVTLDIGGLGMALHELADEMNESHEVGQGPRVLVNVSDDPVRYDPEVELHLFRIVQHACQNAFRHARAKQVLVWGNLLSQHITLTIQDDGVGLPRGVQPDLAWLLEHDHYGLAAMHERAALIGAVLQIDSRPDQGTRIVVEWDVALLPVRITDRQTEDVSSANQPRV